MEPAFYSQKICRTCSKIKGILYDCNAESNPDILRVIQMCADFQRPFTQNKFLICVKCWGLVQAFLDFRKSVQDAQCRFEEVFKAQDNEIADEQSIDNGDPQTDTVSVSVTDENKTVEEIPDRSSELVAMEACSDNEIISISITRETDVAKPIAHKDDLEDNGEERKPSSSLLSNRECEQSQGDAGPLVMEVCADSDPVKGDEASVIDVFSESGEDESDSRSDVEEVDIPVLRRMGTHSSSEYGKNTSDGELNYNGPVDAKQVIGQREKREIRRLCPLKKVLEYPCHMCKAVFTRKSEIDRHLRTCHSTYGCSNCSKFFTSRESLVKHQREHTELRTFVCEKCGQKFENWHHLHYHKKLHVERTNECPVCKKKFITVSNLNSHLKTHSDKREFICSVCGDDFVTEKVLTDHELRHTNDRNYKCTMCDKAFKTSSNLHSHIQVHQELKPHACDWCDYRCKQKTNLTAHINQVHLKSKAPRKLKRKITRAPDISEQD